MNAPIVQDLLDRQHGKQSQRRFNAEPITGFGIHDSPFDGWKDRAEKAMSDLYAASYWAELAIDDWDGVVPHDISVELARITKKVDEMQSTLRAWDGSRGDE